MFEELDAQCLADEIFAALGRSPILDNKLLRITGYTNGKDARILKLAFEHYLPYIEKKAAENRREGYVVFDEPLERDIMLNLGGEFKTDVRKIDFSRLLTEYAYVSYRLGRIKEAEKYICKALDCNSYFLRNYFLLERIYIFTNRYEEAYTILKRMFKLCYKTEDLALLFHELGNYYYRKEEDIWSGLCCNLLAVYLAPEDEVVVEKAREWMNVHFDKHELELLLIGAENCIRGFLKECELPYKDALKNAELAKKMAESSTDTKDINYYKRIYKNFMEKRLLFEQNYWKMRIVGIQKMF